MSIFDQNKVDDIIASIEQGESAGDTSSEHTLTDICGDLDQYALTFDRWVKAQAQPFFSCKPVESSIKPTSEPNTAKGASSIDAVVNRSVSKGVASREKSLQKSNKKKIAPQTISSLLPSALTQGNITREFSKTGDGGNEFKDHFPRLSGESKSTTKSAVGSSSMSSASQWPSLGGTSTEKDSRAGSPKVTPDSNPPPGSKKKKKRAVLLTCNTTMASGGNIGASSWGAAAGIGTDSTVPVTEVKQSPLVKDTVIASTPSDKKEVEVKTIQENYDVSKNMEELPPPPALSHQISHSVQSQLDVMGVSVIVTDASPSRTIEVTTNEESLISSSTVTFPIENVSAPMPITPPTQLEQLLADETASKAATRRMGVIYGSLIMRYHSSLLPISPCIVFLTKLLSVKFIHAGKVIKLSLQDLTKFPSCLLTNNRLEIFAVNVISTIIPVLQSLGGWILSSLTEVLSPIAPMLVKKINDQMKSGEVSTMYITQQQSEEEKLLNISNVEDFIRPFDANIDNRHDYKTQIECTIYNEREKCYDEFCNLFRQFQTINRSDMDGSKTDEFWSGLHARGSRVLNLNDCNYLWFSKIFIEMLLFHGTNMPKSSSPFSHPPSSPAGGASSGSGSFSRSSSYGTPVTPNTSSRHTATALFSSTQKQRKLEERLGQGGGGKGFPSRRGAGAQSMSSTPSSASSTRSSATKNSQFNNVAAVTSQRMKNMIDALNDPSSHFSGNQQFFFRFILVMDSHRLNITLQDLMLTEILQLLEISLVVYKSFGDSTNVETSNSTTGNAGSNLSNSSLGTEYLKKNDNEAPQSPTTGTTSLTLRVLKLRVLGKFLGLLHFSPSWNLSVDSLKESPLMDAAESFATQRNSIRHFIPLSEMLKHCWVRGSLFLCIPWMTSYLQLMSWDKTSVLNMTKTGLQSMLKSSQFNSHSTSTRSSTQILYCISILHALLCSNMFDLRKSGTDAVSQNRVSILFNIQAFLSDFPILIELRKVFLKKATSVPSWNSLLKKPIASPSQDLISEDGDMHHLDAGIQIQIDEGNSGFSQSYLKYMFPELFQSISQMRQRFVRFQRNDEILCERLMSNSTIVSRPTSLRFSPTKRQAPTLISSSTLMKNVGIDEGSIPASTSLLNPSPPRTVKVDIGNSDHNFDIMIPPPPLISPAPSPSATSGKVFNMFSSPPPSLKRNTSGLFYPESNLLTSSSTNYRSNSMPRSSSIGSIQDSDHLQNTTDIQEKLEISFWHQHPHLYSICNFAVDHVNQACRHRLRERVADLVLQAWSYCEVAGSQCLSMATELRAKIKSNSPADNTNAIISKHQAMVEKHTSSLFKTSCSETEEFLGTFVGEHMLDTITPFLSVYPMSNIVKETVISIALRQKSTSIKSLSSYYSDFARKKLSEVCMKSVQQQRKIFSQLESDVSSEINEVPSSSTTELTANVNISSQTVISHVVGDKSRIRQLLRDCLFNIIEYSSTATRYSIRFHSCDTDNVSPMVELKRFEDDEKTDEIMKLLMSPHILMSVKDSVDNDMLRHFSNDVCLAHRDDFHVFCVYFFGMMAKLSFHWGQIVVTAFAMEVRGDATAIQMTDKNNNKDVPFWSTTSMLVLIKNNVSVLSQTITWACTYLTLHEVTSECTGRMKIEVMKMLTSVITLIFTYDFILDQNSIPSIASRERNFDYASSIITQALSGNIINIENIAQLIGYSLKHSIFTTVLALLKFSDEYKNTITAFIGRYLLERFKTDGLDMDIDVDVGSWANDPSVRRIIKKNVSVEIGNVLETLHKK